MKFDIARQPLVPAFLTLAALAVVAMWNAGGPAVSMAVQAGHAAGTVDIGRNAAGALAVSSPGELLAQFQAAHPVWARWIAGLLMLFTGMSVGASPYATTSTPSEPVSPSRSTERSPAASPSAATA